MVEGYTQDTDLVVDDEDEVVDDGGEPVDEPGASPVEPREPSKISSGAAAGIDVSSVDRREYQIDRPEGEPLGQPQSITYTDGNQVKFSYDDDGELVGVQDTASGVTMNQTADGKWVVSHNGQQHTIDGDLSVDPETGDLVATMSDGSTITQHPDGRTTKRDEDGNLVAVSNPNLRTGGSVEYGANGDIQEATDSKGNSYTKIGDGSYLVQTKNGQAYYFNGTITINEHTGVTATPSNPQNIQPGDDNTVIRDGNGNIYVAPQPSSPQYGPQPY